ncbi:hypothetical protein KM043_005189 [Ampulex compressa]|nr:hypothetical protein KM043_005189 [Ampulex compressa]
MIDLQEDGDKQSTIGRGVERTLYPNSLTLDPMHFLPYMDSASWLYLDPSPLLRIATPVMHSHSLDYAMPPPRRKLHRHHHHHHHHHHRHYMRHRRVVSDPGTKNWNAGNQGGKQCRRMFSFDRGNVGVSLLDASIAEASEENPTAEEANTSTFRKVPWHPNLHMLKIRRT